MIHSQHYKNKMSELVWGITLPRCTSDERIRTLGSKSQTEALLSEKQNSSPEIGRFSILPSESNPRNSSHSTYTDSSRLASHVSAWLLSHVRPPVAQEFEQFQCTHQLVLNLHMSKILYLCAHGIERGFGNHGHMRCTVPVVVYFH
jgi:hypothetical protein